MGERGEFCGNCGELFPKENERVSANGVARNAPALLVKPCGNPNCQEELDARLDFCPFCSSEQYTAEVHAVPTVSTTFQRVDASALNEVTTSTTISKDEAHALVLIAEATPSEPLQTKVEIENSEGKTQRSSGAEVVVSETGRSITESTEPSLKNVSKGVDQRSSEEVEARIRAEQEVCQRAEQEAAKHKSEEARVRAEQQERASVKEQARIRAEEEVRFRLEAEALRKAAEELAHKRSEAEVARKLVEEEARRVAEDEARRRAEAPLEILTDNTDVEIQPHIVSNGLPDIRVEQAETVAVDPAAGVVNASESLQDTSKRIGEGPPRQSLSIDMRSLVGEINALIDHYNDNVSGSTKQRGDAHEDANKNLQNADKLLGGRKTELAGNRESQSEQAKTLLGNVDKANEWALDHLRRQSVSPDANLSLTPASLPPQKNAFKEAERLFKEANAILQSLHKIKKPENSGKIFLAIGLVGFVISICAAAGASPGEGGVAFFLINVLSLGVATAIAVAGHAMARSQMKSEFARWLNQKAVVERYIASGKEYADAEYQRELSAAELRFKQAQQSREESIRRSNDEYTSGLTALRKKALPQIQQLKARCEVLYTDAQFAVRDWETGAWNDWQPATTPSFAACMGQLKIGPIEPAPGHQDLDISFVVPAIVPFASGKEGRGLLFKCSGAAKERAARNVQSLITRLIATVPPGKVRFTFIDPVGLGQNASGFMQLADYDESLVSGKVWTEPPHIEQKLLELTEHMETVIQKYLRNDFESIEQYNANAGEIAEAYRVLVVFDFPVNFTETAARRLVSVAENGPRCGVYTVVIMDTSAEKRLPFGFTPSDLERASNVIEHDSGRFVWLDNYFKQHKLGLDQPPHAELSKHILNVVGAVAKTALNVQVPYSKLLARAGLTDGALWKNTTENVIESPLGPHGANKIQSLTLGEKTAHHAIIVGRTGSGKSNLMHVIITSLALSYSPEEIELYLIDFKQGVEFKPYAVAPLPHAKVIAIESEREFGISVLNRLNEQLKDRGEKFREQNVSNISDYRKKVGVLPRILLLVDEFQEFFSQDDNISSQARVILDRLVRQGRSQGIHVMLGSQTLKGASDLPHSIISQMGVRIALQCTEADARQIMGDDNLVNRQLTRPGEAIYNPESGQVEANKLFQVALFTEGDRETYLSKITQLARSDERSFASPIIFEGNEPAKIESCLPLQEKIESEDWPVKLKVADGWLGEPIAIRPPVTARFRRQGGSNLLVVTRDEQQGVGTALASLVSLLSQYAPGSAQFFIVNLTTAESEWNEVPDSIKNLFQHDIQVVGRRNLIDVMQSLATLAEERASDEKSGYSEIFLLFLGLHRARDLRDDHDGVSSYFKSGDESGQDAKALFAKIMREGPESGIHVIAWCDAYANVARIDRRLIGEFAMRVAGPMSSDDSQHVIDDAFASKLDRPHRAIFFDEEQPGHLEKFRPYAIPEIRWIKSIADQLRARDGKSKTASGG
jgi:S-DNA-T family DNA segregation ATPase FtsK/SpoIIIE